MTEKLCVECGKPIDGVHWWGRHGGGWHPYCYGKWQHDRGGKPGWHVPDAHIIGMWRGGDIKPFSEGPLEYSIGLSGVPEHGDPADPVKIRCSCQQWLDHGWALVKYHSVEHVALADKEPEACSVFASNEPVYRWYFPLNDPCTWSKPEHTLPMCLRCTPGELSGQPPYPTTWIEQYPSREEAIAALSRACLALAKGVPS